MYRIKTLIFTIFTLALCTIAHADSSFIDKVYHPYVQPHEKEIEWRWAVQKDSENRAQDNAHTYRLAYGQSISDNWFAEVYLIGEKNKDADFKLTATEVELLWQITEQGEYDVDWGMLFEFEHESNNHVSEVSSAVLIEKEWGRWVTTANLYLIYEWGSRLNNEVETAMALQGRYRYSRALEPAIEFYSSDVSKGIGPVLLGKFRLGGKKQIRWEAGVIFALDNETPAQTLKFIVEFEF